MYQAKPPKSILNDKGPYRCYHPLGYTVQGIPEHSLRVDDNGSFYQIVSIDPGIKNYALRIERRYLHGPVIPLVFNKYDLNPGKKESDRGEYFRLTQILDEHSKLYADCQFVIIESQLPINYDPLRISQHTISYFMLTLRQMAYPAWIIELSPTTKGLYLNGPRTSNKRDLKNWARDKARQILTSRGDQGSLQVMDYHKSKQDDLGDTICQAEALFVLWNLPTAMVDLPTDALARLANMNGVQS